MSLCSDIACAGLAIWGTRVPTLDCLEAHAGMTLQYDSVLRVVRRFCEEPRPHRVSLAHRPIYRHVLDVRRAFNRHLPHRSLLFYSVSSPQPTDVSLSSCVVM
ncbi:unnamed protein product [Sphacelaria rigidula]